MDGALSITYLPNEIIEHILESECLTAKDLCNFEATCTKFRNLLINNNKLWKIKFHQSWPRLVCNSKRHYVADWRAEFKTRLHFGWKVRQLLSQMSAKFYKKEDISHAQLSDFWALLEHHPHAYPFMISELMLILYDHSVSTDLTLKYYAEKVTRLVRQAHLTKKWKNFIALPPERQILERGATMVAQWCQPLIEVPYQSIATQLDSIAARAKEVLQEEHPNHPLLSASVEDLHRFRECNIPDNQWKPSESQEVLSAVCHVLFQEMGFHGNSTMYYSADNSYIDKVLQYRRGIPITLSILFESIARRLGVRCEPVSFPAHFLLRWRDHYGTDTAPDGGSPVYYIDVFNGGQFLTKRSCPRYSSDIPCPMGGLTFQAATAQQVVERIANNLEVAGRQRTHSSCRRMRMRSNLELLHLVSPSDLSCILHLARYYMLYNMDLGDLTETIEAVRDNMERRLRDQAEHIMQMLQVYETHRTYVQSSPETTDDALTKCKANCIWGKNKIEPKLRDPTVQFAVGMIMKHRLFNYRCVIYGWDLLCMESKEWITQMGVDNLSKKADQPFYNVLVEDGSTRYAAQENLEICTEPAYIPHSEVGRYFDRFCVTYFQPNTEKEEEYPQDSEVRMRLLREVGIPCLEQAREM
ncbi:F-box only protein 21-like isoform X1 [Schistocerca cancellata]|uniref:F-box only protein 21-like isoform X1 n=1 Tax=Schistocerca cancellata TaxID=274614 RepID=UPI0021190829|nr:F-box only protein 21-like isoform X1 [Schistocerca cancellata]